MAVSYLVVSAACTVLSLASLWYWTDFSLNKLRLNSLVGENFVDPENANRALELLLGSHATTALLANFLFNVFVLLNLCLKTFFFGELYAPETRKLVERLVNYVIYKGTFLPLVIPPTIFHTGLWSIWLTVLCSLKMFQALARDRLERLNASPAALPWTYFHVYSVLPFVLSVDFCWMWICFVICRMLGSSMFLMLFFEPLSIAFETMQAMLVHGFQLLDIWVYHSPGNSGNCQRFKLFDKLVAGSVSEWKGVLIRNLGFSLDMATLLMALGHYMQIWWLRGMAFHLADAILLLNIRALLSAIVKRVKGFIKLRVALNSLHAAFPDATSEELQAYDDECAICREPMAKAKKLHCNHLFHLACLRSWLDQGLNEMYSCPTCRKPLLVGRSVNETHTRAGEVPGDEQLARLISQGLNEQTAPGHTLPAEAFPDQTRNPMEGLDSSWLHAWPNPSLGTDGAGPSTAVRSAGFSRVQMMMRHLASVGETYAQTALEDAAWNLWPMNPSQADVPSTSLIPPVTGGRYIGGTTGLHMRMRSATDNMANIFSMAETVREVLPHVPDELILQDLQRTNSAIVTVNNLLQM